MAEEEGYICSSMPAMPTKRVFASTAVLDGKLYVVGGCDEKGVPLNSFEVYDASTGDWKVLEPMPTKRAGTAVAVSGNKIVVIGGVSETQAPLSDVEVYDTEQGTWSKQENLSEPLLGVSAVPRAGKVLVVGGMAMDTNPCDKFAIYDVDRNKWKALPPMPTARYASSAFLTGEKLYVIGGRQGKLPCTALEAFSFSDLKWEKLPDVPTKRVFAMYTSTDTHIFSMGGLNQPANLGFSDACECFDLEKKEWFIGVPLPTKRGDFAIGVIGGKVVCAGGLSNMAKPLDIVEAYDQPSDTWTELPKMPFTHCSCAHTMWDGKLYVIGGLSLEGPTNCMETIGASE